MGELGIDSALAAGWYADPSMPGNGRWYDGSAWTNHVYVVPPAPPTPQQQRTADLKARGRGPALTVVGVLVSIMGSMFALTGGLGLWGSSSASDTIGFLVSLLIGAGLLTIGVLMAVAPDKIGARLG